MTDKPTTERLKPEPDSALDRARDSLRNLVDACPAAIVASDASGLITEFNPAAQATLGWTGEEALGQNVRMLYPDNRAEEIMALLRSSRHGGYGQIDALRTSLVSKSGEMIPVEISARIIFADGRETATVGYFTDLRNRLRMEEQLQEAAEHLERVGRQAVIAELAGAAAHEMNQPLQSLLGYAELLRRRLGDDDQNSHAIDTMYAEAKRIADIVRKMERISAYKTKEYVGGQRIFDLDQAASEPTEPHIEIPPGLRKDQIDRGTTTRPSSVTAGELQTAVDAIQPDELPEAIGLVVDELDAAIATVDPEGRIIRANLGFLQLMDTDDLHGVGLTEVFDAPGRLAVEAAWKEVTQGGRIGRFEASLLTEGASLPVRGNVVRIERGGRVPLFVVAAIASDVAVSDVHAQLARADELLNLGTLATGVAHELKNPLTTILNYADYLKTKYASTFDEKDGERLQRIIDGVGRINNFVHELVLLARPGDGTPERVSLHTTIRDSLLLAEGPILAAGARVELDLCEDDPQVRSAAQLLPQVFVNLLANAAQSMGGRGGTIWIRTQRVGDQAVCRIADDGVGMDEATRQRIFEPFFTTRSKKTGSGLGLPIVRSIVIRHAGRITVESKLGAGTTFTIRFPCY